LAKHDSVGASEENDVTEEARDDEIRRSVPSRLDRIINLKHELAQLAGQIDWDFIDGEIAPLHSDKERPGIPTRFAIGLLLLKHIYGLSAEGVCERWVYDRYFQYFTGKEFFQHEFPHERSDLSHWRKRLGDKLELLLAESLRAAHASGALRSQDLKRVTVDTTVQPKNISFPADAKLLHAAIKALNRLASKHGVRLRQSYVRVAKRAAMMAGRYAHAKQFNRPRLRRRGDRTAIPFAAVHESLHGTKRTRSCISAMSVDWGGSELLARGTNWRC
jgi:transposase, IS5 family